MTLATKYGHDPSGVGRAEELRRFVWRFTLTTAGVNAGIGFTDADSHQHFADGDYLDFVNDQWNDIVVANPSLRALLLTAGEILLGTLLLSGGTAARSDWPQLAVRQPTKGQHVQPAH